jgi:ubiquinone/menaquinone biosynthesis C-methylase UbiE
MDRPMPRIAFNMMATMFKVRDWLRPRREFLEEAGLKVGDRVLDFGCGPGAYAPDASEMVGESGKVYALDLHPLAVARVRNIARQRRLTNVQTIQSDGKTALPDASVDVVLLYDVFHALDEPQAVLGELNRVVKPGGVLSVNEPHMDERDLIAGVSAGGLFGLARRGDKTYTFAKSA